MGAGATVASGVKDEDGGTDGGTDGADSEGSEGSLVYFLPTCWKEALGPPGRQLVHDMVHEATGVAEAARDETNPEDGE